MEKEKNKYLKDAIDRIDFRTTGAGWRKVVYIAGIIAGVGGGILMAPINLPAAVVTWVKVGTIIASSIAGGAYLDKSNVSLKNTIKK